MALNGTRRYVLVGAGTVVAVALLVTAALVATRRQPDRYPADSPQATVQAYFQALIDQRPLDAHDLYSPDLQARCDPPTGADLSSLSITRVTLAEVDVEGDKASVAVQVTQSFDGSPFGLDESTLEQRLQLTADDDGSGWLIAEEPWPWFPCRKNG